MFYFVNSFIYQDIYLLSIYREDVRVPKKQHNNVWQYHFCLKFESWWSSLSCMTTATTPRFVVDGQAPMRQCLHPEACNKDIVLPEHYNHFHDLRKDFVACYSSHGELSTLGVQEMLQCILFFKKKTRYYLFLREFSLCLSSRIFLSLTVFVLFVKSIFNVNANCIYTYNNNSFQYLLVFILSYCRLRYFFTFSRMVI